MSADPYVRPGEDFKFSTPNGLRMVDYLAGGSNNFSADKWLAEELEAIVGGVGDAARNAAAFKQAVVRGAVGMGIRQFVDLGTGIPRRPYLYETAQYLDPDALVVSVENDLTGWAWVKTMLDANDLTPVFRAPFLTPDVLHHRVLTRHLNPIRPVCVLLVSAAHTAPLVDLADLLKRMVSQLPAGSMLAFSQWAIDDDHLRWSVNGLMAERTQSMWGLARSSTEITEALMTHPMLGPPGPIAPATDPLALAGSARRPTVTEFGGIIHLGRPQVSTRPGGSP
ncbi:SAM-dependent methyltransferase (plasmid) [Streptomyces viridifaciens]|nr:SAM-dependent methyltransferase [Streptomyces viridifaciens]